MQSDHQASRFERENVERYLHSVLGKDIRVVNLHRLGEPEQGKGFGYGIPLQVEYETDGGRQNAVLHTMGAGSFGHENMADRARILLWSHRAFNRLPRHVRSFDVGGFESSGDLISLGKVEEFCLLTEYAEGTPYALDLERLRDTGRLGDLDISRARALCGYLAEIHAKSAPDPDTAARLYIRRNRELVGDGECIMGLTDSYPEHPLFTPALLEQIEHRAVEWRWRLRNRTHRLRQVHGDFHPWNILFGAGTDFRVLDRSRGDYGDPADDVTCITINFLFFSLQNAGRLAGAFERLFLEFWEKYLENTGDRELLEVVAPFFVFRALVLASPVWYPAIDDSVRQKLLRFILAVLDQNTFDPQKVNEYCGA